MFLMLCMECNLFNVVLRLGNNAENDSITARSTANNKKFGFCFPIFLSDREIISVIN